MEKVRVDKWLWGIRLYKTRTMATKACDAGRVKIDDEIVKASRQITEGEIIQVRHNYQNKQFKVVKLIAKRVGAAVAQECYIDLTPKEEVQRFRSAFHKGEQRDRGTGRPTKKERREIDKYKDGMDDIDQ